MTRLVTLFLCLVAAAASGSVVHVPADQLTIQAGIDAAAEGDTVLVAPGTYTGDGNRDIDFGGKNVVLKSSDGAEATIIDCQASSTDPHRGFHFHNRESAASVVEGFTIQGARAPNHLGSGICCNNSSPTIKNNIVRGDTAANAESTFEGTGGGIYCLNLSAKPLITGNVIENCHAYQGGAIGVSTGAPRIVGNVIRGCSAISAGAAFYGVFTEVGGEFTDNLIVGNSGVAAVMLIPYDREPIFRHNTIAYNPSRGLIGGENLRVENCLLAGNELDGFYCSFSTWIPEFIGCNIYGNGGGDWIDCIADQLGVNGNISMDPLLCDPENGDFDLSLISPCAAQNNFMQSNIGARGISCGSYTRGDLDWDGEITQTDVELLAMFYFNPWDDWYLPTVAADMDCDGGITLADVILLAAYYYGYGDLPYCGPPPKRPDRPGRGSNNGGEIF